MKFRTDDEDTRQDLNTSYRFIRVTDDFASDANLATSFSAHVDMRSSVQDALGSPMFVMQ